MADPWEEKGKQKSSLAFPGFPLPSLVSIIKPFYPTPFSDTSNSTDSQAGNRGSTYKGGCGVEGRMQTMEGTARASRSCEGKQWQVLLWPIREKVSGQPT